MTEGYWKRVTKKPDGCWPWSGKTDRWGYGVLTWIGKRRGAHRVVWMLSRGVEPEAIDGQCVCHTCDHAWCQNPDHLFLGSQQDNTADKTRKGRAARGEKNSGAKVSEADVRWAREVRAAGATLGEIAARLLLHPGHVSKLLRGLKWRHIQ